MRKGFFKAFEANEFDELVYIFFTFLVNVAGTQAKGYIVADCEPGKKIRLLKSKAAVAAWFCDFCTVYKNLAACWAF